MNEHREALVAHRVPFRRLGELLGRDCGHADCPAGWIENRDLMTHRKWSPVTMAALNVACQAVDAAGWSGKDLVNAALVVGTSRGNAAGWLGPWPGRRPFKLMAASNTMHGESASAISIELGIAGPNHVISTGCAAGLDAVGVAMMLLQSGRASKALVVAVDLPLVPALLDHYAASGILADELSLDPYHPQTRGFIPAEGAAAMAIESGEGAGSALLDFNTNSDACDPMGIPADGGRTPELFEGMGASFPPAHAVCPHATGTGVQAAADPAALNRAFPASKPSLHLLKPYLGHAIGASGLLESVVLAEFLKEGQLPPNLPGLHAPDGFTLPDETISISGPLAKLSHGMGGHNALLLMAPPGVF
ncbi:MAG: beta-ketoacyl synthase N-terminal-like domain-containing protein [Akkermansiaceae bacterium]|nr:beta-ketoacyl synthase N-terminal-like domain-containing protein [Akkermansiaceae bacterium]